MTGDGELRTLPRGVFGWLRVFGPGAVIASLTIGTGELIFSSRAGALFAFDALWVFVGASVLKWVLVFSIARHMVLSGAHPFERWSALPGPRGWFPLFFLLLAVVCFPFWVGFHASVLGTLVQWTTGLDYRAGGAIVLTAVLAVVFAGGYRALERIQLAVVVLMLVCVGVAVLLLAPDWGEMLGGLVPQSIAYPAWLPERYPKIAATSVWVENARYVGVVGGASYDYLAYVHYLREKGWGRAGRAVASASELEEVARSPEHPSQRWVRAPFVDLALSFLAVIVFSAIFMAAGVLVMRPAQQVPSGDQLVTFQEQVLAAVSPHLRPLYVTGVFLALAGTLYATIEVAPTVVREVVRALSPALEARRSRRLRLLAVIWCALGGYFVLGWSLLRPTASQDGAPPELVAFLTPAALFTGVLSCAFVCLLNPWLDRRFLPPGLRMGSLATVLNYLAGLVFLAVGGLGLWLDDARVRALWAMAIGLVLSVGIAGYIAMRRRRSRNI